MAIEKQFIPTDPIAEQVLDKSKRLVVPRFQRVYSWKDSNLNEFYEDFIATAANSPEHKFLGTLVFDASKNTHFEVIDGQQRVMTLTIVLAVIRDILQEEIGTASAIALATTIQNEHISAGSSLRARVDGDADSGGSIYILTAEKSMREFFIKYISKGDMDLRNATKPSNEGERNVERAYTFFRQKITKDKLAKKADKEGNVTLLNKLAESLIGIQFILINVHNSDMAYALFESHNAKGADLLVSDLIKSYFYGQLRGPDDVKEKRIKEWDRSVTLLKSGANMKIDKFLHYYVQSYEGKFTKAQLYTKIKKRIGKSDKTATAFMKDLESNVDLLLRLRSGEIESVEEHYLPHETKIKINAALTYISDFKVDQCYILLLSLFRNRQKFSPTFLRKIVELIENFTFVYSKISKGQANVIEKLYAQLATEIEAIDLDEISSKPNGIDVSSGKIFSRLEKHLSKEVKYEVFLPKFKDLDYTKSQQKKLIQYSFAKIENYKNNGGSILGVDSNLDHIIARNPKNSTATQIARLHSIGNLVPIDKLSNSRLGNKPLPEKIEAYKNIQNITLVRELVGFIEENDNNIDDEAIDRRTEDLARVGYEKVWKI